ncbi:MAG TPA: hypothetical protein PKD24_00830 [Pyrinomonadaceae bacterium]|nr:hypothetical protein [Pyrinomonadaceae bacterium]HMP64300.1 hypothetical protein [Pyrinomonadaceae bacterium]
MNIDSSHKNHADDKDLLASLKDHVIQTLLYSIFAAAIFVTTLFSWWLGFILFLVFVFLISTRLLISGFVVFVMAAVSLMLFSWVRKRGVNLNRLDEMTESITSLTKLNLLIVLLEIYLISITVLLAGVLLFGWFS